MVDQFTLQTISIVITGLTLSIAAIYYMLTLRYTRMNLKNTLETRQAQMFMGIYNQLNRSEFVEAWQLVFDVKWTTWEEYRAYSNVPENGKALWILGMFYEGLGVLVKEELVDIRLVAETITGMTRMWWEKYLPIIDEGRKSMNLPRLYSETEYLYNKLMNYIEEHPELKT